MTYVESARRSGVVIVLFVVVFFGSAGARDAAARAGKGACVRTIGECPAKGCGGDALLNTLKNVAVAAARPRRMRLEDLIGLEQPGRWRRGQARGSLKEEGQQVVVEAFIIGVKRGEPETCNCNLHGKAAVDIRASLAASDEVGSEGAVVAEITPRYRPEGWTLKKLKSLAAAHAFVRVSGYLLFDSEHVGRARGWRATLWEVHPITGFEVCASGDIAACQHGEGWKKLEEF